MSRLSQRYEAGLDTARRYFMGEADVQKAARNITGRLREMGIPHAICGGLAVTAHGHIRVTEDVDVLLTAEGLARFKERWLGRGWVERFPGSRGLRDAQFKVRIDFCLTGEYPGDGKPGPVAFPEPARAADVSEDGTAIVSLPVLIELKLASAMTAPDRPRDYDDVIQLIRANDLPRDFTKHLNPYVHARYEEHWGYAQIRDEEH
jgi:hypothetical protein